MQEALGIIETKGFATAVEAADAALKAANVRVAEYQKAGGGRVDIILRGDVAAVKAAVEAAVASASQIGKVEGQTVIPRPADKISPVFNLEPMKEDKKVK